MRTPVSELKDSLNGLADRLHRLSPLAEHERRAICGLWREMSELSIRSPLPCEGDIGFIVSGWACHQRRAEGGRRQIIGFLTPGDSHRARRHAESGSVQAVCLTHVQFVDASSLFEDPHDHPALILALDLCERRAHERMIDHIVRLASRDARGGLAHLILELEARVGSHDGLRPDWFAMPIGQRSLADAMGFSIVHVNHTLAWLRDQGFLDVQEGRARVLDRRRMEALASGQVRSPPASGPPATD